jgi:hypothetical protein
MRVLFGWIVLVLAAAGASPVLANGRDALPFAAASYPSSGLAARLDAGASAPVDDDRFLAWSEEDASPGAQSYLPVLYSALVPGLGEMTMGYWGRGIALAVVEVAAWSGYFVKHDDGINMRTQYEAFADAHWNYDKWIDDHPCPTVPPTGATLDDVEDCGKASSGSGAWPGYIPWVSKEEDKQHYYENIGKYDWYISGWSDWDPTQTPYAHQTDLRTEYRGMRQESNDALDAANSFVWVSLAARTFSIVETAIIVHNRREGTGAGGKPAPVSLRARPRGYDGGEVALEVRFK